MQFSLPLSESKLSFPGCYLYNIMATKNNITNIGLGVLAVQSSIEKHTSNPVSR
jgi:hypothetical protein